MTRTDKTTTATRQDFLALFPTAQDAMTAEDATLNAVVGQAAALQAPAAVEEVIGGHDVADDHPEYWAWLIEQCEDREEEMVAALDTA